MTDEEFTSEKPEGYDEELAKLMADAKKAVAESGQTWDPMLDGKIEEQFALSKKYRPAAAAKEVATKKEGPQADDGAELHIEGQPTTVVTAKTVTEYNYESPEDREFMDFYIPARRLGRIKGHLIIIGPSGQGKTEGVHWAGDRHEVKVHKMDCAAMTTTELWLGAKEIDAKGTRFDVSEFIKMVECDGYEPGIILLDEFTRLHAVLHNVLFGILDGTATLFVPQLHRYVHVDPRVIFIATANIGGRFTGTYTMDQAMRERFPYVIERDFPPEDEEVRILMSRYPDSKQPVWKKNVDGSVATPKVDIRWSEQQARMMVQIANKSRTKWRTDDIDHPVSTRSLVHAAALCAHGASVKRAFELTVLPGYATDGAEKSQRELVRALVAGKGA